MEHKVQLRTIIEAIILYVGLPLIFFWDWVPLPKILVLVIVALYCGYQLWQDDSFGRGWLSRSNNQEVSKTILVRTIAVAGCLVALTWLVEPTQLFAFPVERPVLWMLVLILYPVLSALPQEFIYRTFFFHRYGPLMNLRHAPAIASALAFAFLHIVYDNWWAVGLSFIAGLLLGFTYERTQSLFWVTVEHAIYGWLIFTLGMGNFFYEPF